MSNGIEMRRNYEACLGSSDRLTQTGLPNQNLASVWMNFTHGETIYTAVHVVNYHPAAPYILLSAEGNDLYNFSIVRSKLARLADGTFNDHITDRTTDICSRIDLDPSPQLTPRRILKSLERYRREFPNARITTAHYQKISGEDLRNVKVPLL